MIGFGAPKKAGTEGAHGAPLGKDEIAATREKLGWSHAPFEIPEEIYAGWRAGGAGTAREAQWNRVFDAYALQYPELASELVRRSHGELPQDWQDGAAPTYASCSRRIDDRIAQGLADGSRRLRPLPARTGRRLGDSRAFEPHAVEGSKDVKSEDPNANYVY